MNIKEEEKNHFIFLIGGDNGKIFLLAGMLGSAPVSDSFTAIVDLILHTHT